MPIILGRGTGSGGGSGGPPSGPAGGDLSGTYPNPDVASVDPLVIEPLTWQTVVGTVGFQNGWSDLGAPYGLVSYARDQSFVYLSGLASNAAANIGFTLPVGFRPSAQRLFYFVGAGAVGGIEIPTTGAVTGFGGIPATVSFDSVMFRLA